MTARAGASISGTTSIPYSSGRNGGAKRFTKGSLASQIKSSSPASSAAYKNQGWYAAGGIYETWISSTPGGMPPSGHTLTNIQFVPLQG